MTKSLRTRGRNERTGHGTGGREGGGVREGLVRAAAAAAPRPRPRPTKTETDDRRKHLGSAPRSKTPYFALLWGRGAWLWRI